MRPYTKFLPLGLVLSLIVSTLGGPACTTPTKGLPAHSTASGRLDSTKSVADMLADVSQDVGRVSSQEGSGKPRICVLEEKHTSVVGQFEIALMLLRLHERYGLRDIALEGLTKDKQFPSIKWFTEMGGPEDAELKNEIAVGLLRDGEISAVELIAMVFPDVVVHAADDADAYRVELSNKGAAAGGAFLVKIGLKSVRPDHYAHIQQLTQQKKGRELAEYVISVDPWAQAKYEELKKDRIASVEEMRQNLREIQERAASVGAELTDQERAGMSEAMAFFDAADRRSRTMVDTALSVGATAPLVAMNVGAAHTPGIMQMLHDAQASYAVLRPLSLEQNLKAADLGSPEFERKNKLLSVAFTGKGLGSFLDGRRKPRPATGEPWLESEGRLRFAAASLARAAATEPNFPSPALKKAIDSLDEVNVNWTSVRKRPNGDVFFTASVLTQKGRVNISTVCGMPKGIQTFVNRKRKTLEQLLKDVRDDIKKEPGPRQEPKNTPVIEFVTPDVSAAFALDSTALDNMRISG
jgi:hypothetical protein